MLVAEVVSVDIHFRAIHRIVEQLTAGITVVMGVLHRIELTAGIVVAIGELLRIRATIVVDTTTEVGCFTVIDFLHISTAPTKIGAS
jgi:hypothetical protein